MEIKLFNLYIESKLYKLEKQKSIKNFETKYNVHFDKKSLEISQYKLPKEFLEVYETTNGMKITWEDSKNKNVRGQVHFLKMNEVVSNWEGQIYEKEDLENNDLLAFFHPFDLVTSEAQCGFMITPEETYKSIFYNKSGQTETERLELDFAGYVTMLYHSAAYQNWPLVILDIINNEESSFTKEFKANMKALFEDFSWDEYVETFNQLRLDK